MLRESTVVSSIVRSARVAAALVAGASLLGTGGCGPPPLPQFVHPAVLSRASLEYYWQMQLPLDDDEKVLRVDLLEENLYCLTNENRLWAVDASGGGIKWVVRVANRDQTVFGPSHASNLVLPDKTSGISEIMGTIAPAEAEPFDAVLINTLSKVFVFDRATGEMRREIEFDFPANTGGASDSELFYVASTKGWCHAFALREALQMWTISTAAMVTAPVEYHAGHVYVASQDGTVYAAQAGRKNNIVWRRALGGPISTGIGVDDRGCFVPCDDNRIYALNPLTGEPLWAPFICEGQLLRPIQVGSTTLFQRAEGDKLYALNLANGRQRWAVAGGDLVLAVIDSKVYLLDEAGALQVVDEILGTVGHSLDLAGMELFVPNTTAPAIYTATADGHLFCIRPKRAEHLTPEILKKAAQ